MLTFKIGNMLNSYELVKVDADKEKKKYEGH